MVVLAHARSTRTYWRPIELITESLTSTQDAGMTLDVSNCSAHLRYFIIRLSSPIQLNVHPRIDTGTGSATARHMPLNVHARTYHQPKLEVDESLNVCGIDRRGSARLTVLNYPAVLAASRLRG